jgi:hypothetical protein
MNTPAKFLKGALALLSLCFLQTTFAGVDKAPVSNTSVTVNNTAANPVPVTVQNVIRTRGADALQVYDQAQSKSANATDYIDSISFDVPAGKRLVIETITLFSNLQPGQTLWSAQFRTTVNGSSVFGHMLSVEAQGINGNGGPAFAATHSIRGYCDGGAGVLSIGFSRNANTGNWSVGASVTGYLVDIVNATS